MYDGTNIFPGIITHLFESDGRIDNLHYFKKSCAKNVTLSEGLEVQYLARKDSDDQTRIIEIQGVTSEVWGDGKDYIISELQTNRPELFSTRQMILNGTITDKVKNTMIISFENQDEIEVEIDKVSTNFQPMKGDKICAQVQVQTDPTKVKCMGSIIRIVNIAPLTIQRIEGYIRKLPDPARPSTNYGIVEDDYMFFSNAFDNADNIGRKPGLGDQIIAEAITSPQMFGYKSFNWRCIKIIPYTEIHIELTSPSFKQVDRNPDGFFITPSDDLTVNMKKDESKMIKISIENTSNGARTLINVVGQLNMGSKFLTQLNLPLTLKPEEEFVIDIEVAGTDFGLLRMPIAFKFDGDEEETATRMIQVDVDTELKVDSKDLCEYVGWQDRNFAYTRSVQKRNQHTNILRGEKTKVAPNFVDVKLKPYEVPNRLADTVYGCQSKQIIQEELRPVLPSYDILTERTYAECFHNLLYLEELHHIHCIRRYDRERAFFTPKGEYLIMEMHNIQESRPSLIVGKTILK